MEIKEIQSMLKLMSVVGVAKATGISAPTVRKVRDKGQGGKLVIDALSRHLEGFKRKLARASEKMEAGK